MARPFSPARLAGPAALAALVTVGPVAAAERVDYAAYGQGTFLPYLNAPTDPGTRARVPRLLVSFGGEARPIVMDTGSTGIVVSAERIPNLAALPSRPGRLLYSSSGRVMIGQWVTTPLTVFGRDGQAIAVAPIPVLAVTRIDCTDTARDCRPEDAPRGVAMMGVGFDREGDGQSQSTPAANPFLNVAPGGSGLARRGYVVTRDGVHVGLTRANTEGDFRFIKLAPHPTLAGEWQGVPVCITVNGATPPQCGSALVDTGVTSMFLTLPPAAVAGTVTDPDAPDALDPGTVLSFAFPGAGSGPVAAAYSLQAGDAIAPMAPDRIHLNTSRPTPFVNTSVRFLDGFDVLYDADGGYVAFRPRGDMRAALRAGPPP